MNKTLKGLTFNSAGENQPCRTPGGGDLLWYKSKSLEYDVWSTT